MHASRRMRMRKARRFSRLPCCALVLPPNTYAPLGYVCAYTPCFVGDQAGACGAGGGEDSAAKQRSKQTHSLAHPSHNFFLPLNVSPAPKSNHYSIHQAYSIHTYQLSYTLLQVSEHRQGKQNSKRTTHDRAFVSPPHNLKAHKASFTSTCGRFEVTERRLTRASRACACLCLTAVFFACTQGPLATPPHL
jgi:hypothetical protein